MAWFLRAALVALCFTADLSAAVSRVTQNFVGTLQRSRQGEVVTLKGLDLSQPELRDLEVERFQVWAPDAEILVWEGGDEPRRMAPPKAEYFKGRVVGSDESVVFFAVREGRLSGMIIDETRRYSIGTGRRLRQPRNQEVAFDDPILIAEVDDFAATEDPGSSWTCDLDDQNNFLQAAPNAKGLEIKPHGGLPSGASYSLRIAVETDNEFCAAFGNNATTISNYVADLVAKSSIIYSRDVQTALLLGTVSIRNAGADPFTATSADDTSVALAEMTREWVNNATLENAQRSAAVMLSGKAFNGGIAWVDALCFGQLSCEVDGSGCGSPAFANAFYGPYGFVGSLNSGVVTTVPDPTLTVGGVQFAVGSGNNFWMLAAFAHELGHIVASPHSSCVPLTAGQKAEFGIGSTSMPDRSFVDTCLSGGSYNNAPCYSGAESAPTEFGSIMSYCHNIFAGGGNRSSRYYLGKPGEASSLMLPIFKNAIDAATPNGTITLAAGPLTCGVAVNASVPTTSGATYLWSINGGTINSGGTTTAVNFTPTSPTVTLTVQVSNPHEDHGCSITVSAQRATTCGAITAPTGVVATATGPTSVFISWNAVSGAASYKVLRTSHISNSYTEVGNPAGNSFTDTSALSGTAYLYRVRAVDGSANASPDSASDLATTVVFTDASLAGVRAKAVHFTELRTAVNAIKALAGQGAFAFSGASPIVNGPINASHITDLRGAVNSARTGVGMPSAVFTDPTVTIGSTSIKAVHLLELRLATQ